MIGQLHSPDCGSPAHGHCTTAGSSFVGFSGFRPHRPTCREIAVISFLKPNVQPPQVYTSSPSAHPPQTIPIVGVTTPLPKKTLDEKTDRIVTMAPDFQEAPPDSKMCCIIPTPASILDVPSISSTSSYPIVMVLELVILAEANPEHVNRPGRGKDYLCHLCPFQHTNYDCTLTHIRKHLNITIRCPGSGQGFQNATSLCKHGQRVHQIRIVTSAEEQ